MKFFEIICRKMKIDNLFLNKDGPGSIEYFVTPAPPNIWTKAPAPAQRL